MRLMATAGVYLKRWVWSLHYIIIIIIIITITTTNINIIMMIDVWRDDGFGALFTNIHVMFTIWRVMYRPISDLSLTHTHTNT